MATDSISLCMADMEGNGVPGGIRTHDPLLRRQSLYPLSYRDMFPALADGRSRPVDTTYSNGNAVSILWEGQGPTPDFDTPVITISPRSA